MHRPRPLRTTAALVAIALALTGCSHKLPVQPVATLPDVAAEPQVSPSALAGDVIPGSYIVTLRAEALQQSAFSLRSLATRVASGAGVTPRRTYGTVFAGFVATMTADQATTLAQDPAVAVVEPDRVVRAYDQAVPAGVAAVRAPVAHARTIRGATVKVGVIDTGIDYGHPDLAANYAGGVDIVNGDEDPLDDNGHGTHVSGTIAALDDAAGVLGVAPAVRLYGIKVLAGNGGGSVSGVIAGMDWAVAHGVQVINLSLGSASGSQALQVACDNAAKAGVVICAAAGNSGGKVGYPAAYASCVCVSAVDTRNVLASFSCRGPEVDLCAPGTDVLSTWPGGGYQKLQGTSMATPHVAGVVALLWSTGRYTTAAQVRDRMLATCTDLGARGNDVLYGRGLVNADAATAPPPNQLPVAKAGGPYTAFAGTPVAFTSAASSDPDGRIVAWWWEFGDGATSVEANPAHAYSKVASFTARLTVTDDRGGRATATASVRIKAVPPDVVTITRADWARNTRTLTVSARSSDAAAVLRVDLRGPMTYDAATGLWTLVMTVDKLPGNVRVVSTKGGSATRIVRAV